MIKNELRSLREAQEACRLLNQVHREIRTVNTRLEVVRALVLSLHERERKKFVKSKIKEKKSE